MIFGRSFLGERFGISTHTRSFSGSRTRSPFLPSTRFFRGISIRTTRDLSGRFSRAYPSAQVLPSEEPLAGLSPGCMDSDWYFFLRDLARLRQASFFCSCGLISARSAWAEMEYLLR